MSVALTQLVRRILVVNNQTVSQNSSDSKEEGGTKTNTYVFTIGWRPVFECRIITLACAGVLLFCFSSRSRPSWSFLMRQQVEHPQYVVAVTSVCSLSIYRDYAPMNDVV